VSPASIAIAPGATDTVVVTIAAADSGTTHCAITATDACGGIHAIDAVALRLAGIPAPDVSICAPAQLSAKELDELVFPLMLTGLRAPDTVHDATFVVRYDPVALAFMRLDSSVCRLAVTNFPGALTLSMSGCELVAPAPVVAIVRFRVLVVPPGDTISIITIDSLKVSPATIVARPCASTLTIVPLCGADRAGILFGQTALESPYPNPLASRATIRFALSGPGPARIVLRDVFGREVARLADTWFTSGEHSLPLDASAITSGMYLVEMSASGSRFRRVVSVVR
jgi:hypothetical protein